MGLPTVILLIEGSKSGQILEFAKKEQGYLVHRLYLITGLDCLTGLLDWITSD